MTKGVVCPIFPMKLYLGRHVDLIDTQSMVKSKFKCIKVYQDHLTKSCVFRALTSKFTTEVAFQLMDIFLLFGAPVILQSDNGSEFTTKIITGYETALVGYETCV